MHASCPFIQDIIVADQFQFNLKITRGNTVVSFEKLWFLQKSHAQRAAMNANSPTFEDMVARVSKLAQENHSTEQLYAHLIPTTPISPKHGTIKPGNSNTDN